MYRGQRMFWPPLQEGGLKEVRLLDAGILAGTLGPYQGLPAS